MSKKNDIRLSKRENHKVPNSEVRGLLNSAKKQEKIASQKFEGGFMNYLMNDKKASTMFNWATRIALGLLFSGFMHGFDSPANAYWVVYLSSLTILDFYKKEK